MSREITTKELSKRLKKLGYSKHLFDRYCGYKSGTTLEIFRTLKDQRLSPEIDRHLCELEEAQENLAIAAADFVFCHTKDSEHALIFLPYFPTYRIYNDAGYYDEYAPYVRYCADEEHIFQRLTCINLNILYFTPLSTKYRATDVFVGYPDDVEKVIVDPLELKKILEPNKGKGRRKMTLTDEAKQKAIETNANKIFRGAMDAVKAYKDKNGKYPTDIWLPVYLDARVINRRTHRKIDAFIYNFAVNRACEALLDIRKTDESYDWEDVSICDPTGPIGGCKEDDLFIDVLGEIYDFE